MRTLILAATALAFLSSTALAQGTTGGSPAPAAQSGDTMSKGGDGMKMAPKKKAKKAAKKSSAAKSTDDATKQ